VSAGTASDAAVTTALIAAAFESQNKLPQFYSKHSKLGRENNCRVDMSTITGIVPNRN
jgi:hypothetical protein